MRVSASRTCASFSSSWRSYGSTCHGAPGWGATGSTRSGLGSSSSTELCLGPRALRLSDPGTHAVAGHRAAHEHHVAGLGARDPRPAVGEPVDASALARHPSGDAGVRVPGRLPRRPMVAGPGRRSGVASAELRLDRLQHGLAVRVAALVVAHLAQLGGRQVRSAGPPPGWPSGRRSAVIGKSGPTPAARRARSAWASAGRRRPHRAATRARRLLARPLRPRHRPLADARGAALDLVAAAAEQLLEVLRARRSSACARAEAGCWRAPGHPRRSSGRGPRPHRAPPRCGGG